MKVVFFGTPDFALPSIEALLSGRHKVVAAVCQPDKPGGRGLHTHKPAVGCLCERLSLPVCQPGKLKISEIEALFCENGADIGVVVAYGKIISRKILDIPPRGFVNVHASLLPMYRGASPVARAIIEGDQETGVSIMKLDEGMDTGPVYAVEKTPVYPDETAGELSSRLARMGAAMLLRTLDAIEAGTAVATPQSGDPSFAPLLTKKDGRLDWALPARSIHDFVRGMNPWPGAICGFRGLETHVWKTKIAQGTGDPGSIIEARRKVLRVAAGVGAVDILEIQLPGKKRHGPSDFINGTHAKSGEKFAGAPSGEC